MEKLENCGYCGHKPYISIYFSLRDQEIIYHVECPFCHHIEVTDIDKKEAINGIICIQVYFHLNDLLIYNRIRVFVAPYTKLRKDCVQLQSCVRCIMNIGFYFIKSDFFRLVNSGLEWMDSTTNKHMYFVLPLKNELWAIPLSSQYNKYKNWYNEAKQLNKKNRFLIFVNVMNRDGVLLIQNAFPITKTFIDREAFDKHNNHLTLSSDLIQFVEKRLKLMNTYEEKGILNFHANLNLIRNILHKNSGNL